jgi:RNA polymerase sigma factor (sigma-70 family)
MCQDSRLGGQPSGDHSIDLGTGMTDNTGNTGLQELFRSHYDEVLAYCARRIGRNEAEDAAADVFAIASRRVDEIDWSTARPWLSGIARGVLANQWRSQRRRLRLLGLMAGQASISVDRPEDLVIHRAEDLGAFKALERMRPTDREVLMLSAWEELTGPEIAQALGVSVSAAEQRLHRAKSRFAATLKAVTAQPSRNLALENEGGN